MSLTPNLLALLKNLDTSKNLFNALRLKRQEELDYKKENYTWASTGYKIYPSSLKSLTMCPKRFIEQDVHKPPGWTVPMEYSMAMGRAIHLMLQEELAKKDRFLYTAPDFSEHEHRDILHKKFMDNYPEVPVLDPELGLSGRADLVINVFNKPVVIDIKTTFYPDIKTNRDGDIEIDRWAKYTKSLPKSEHKLQTAVYAHYINKGKYYDKKIESAGVCYINYAIQPGEALAELECYFDLTDELFQTLDELMSCLKSHRSAYLDGEKTINCTYSKCNAHRKTR